MALGSSARNGVNLYFLSIRPLRVSSRAQKREKKGSETERAQPNEEKRYVMGQRGVYAMAYDGDGVGGVVALLAGLLPLISIFRMHWRLPLFGFNCCMHFAAPSDYVL